jgi:hypothetical protein
MRLRDGLHRAIVPACTHRPFARRGALIPAACALLAATSGCYRYAPAEPTAVAPDAEIRVTLNDEGYRTVLPQAAPVGRRTVEGRMVGLVPDSLIMSVWIGEAYRGTPFETTYQRVPIPRSDVLLVEDRQLSKGRTALLAAGVVAVIVTLIDQLDVVQIFGDGEPIRPDPPEPDGLIRRGWR